VARKAFRLPARVDRTVGALLASGQVGRAAHVMQEAGEMARFYADHPEMIERFTRVAPRHTEIHHAESVGLYVTLHDVESPKPLPQSALPVRDPEREQREAAIAAEVRQRNEQRDLYDQILHQIDEMLNPSVEVWERPGMTMSCERAASMRAQKREKVLFPGNGQGEQGEPVVVPPVVGEWWRPGWDATERIKFFSPKGGR
jgi:hypothetical protein